MICVDGRHKRCRERICVGIDAMGQLHVKQQKMWGVRRSGCAETSPHLSSILVDSSFRSLTHVSCQASKEATVIFGMKTCFGGSKSSCFALVYDTVDAAKKFEPKHRLISSGHIEKADLTVARKQRKEKKNRMKKVRGTKKSSSK